MKNFNCQCYENKEKAMLFINHLLEENLDKDSVYYNDIHIRQEESLIIVEWAQVYYEFETELGKFDFVDGNQVVMTEYFFPDNHTELCYDEDDYKQRLEEFLEENPDFNSDDNKGYLN